MRPLKIGDRVVCIRDYDNGGWAGLSGTVVAIYEKRDDVGVEFDRQSNKGFGYGHDLNKRIENDNGWWFPYFDIYYYVKIVEKNKQLEFDF